MYNVPTNEDVDIYLKNNSTLFSNFHITAKKQCPTIQILYQDTLAIFVSLAIQKYDGNKIIIQLKMVFRSLPLLVLKGRDRFKSFK